MSAREVAEAARTVGKQLRETIDGLNEALAEAEVYLLGRWPMSAAAIEIDETHALFFWKGLWVMNRDHEVRPICSVSLNLRTAVAPLIEDLAYQLEEPGDILGS